VEALHKGDHVLVDGQLVSSQDERENGKSKKARAAKFAIFWSVLHQFRPAVESGSASADGGAGAGFGRSTGSKMHGTMALRLPLERHFCLSSFPASFKTISPGLA